MVIQSWDLECSNLAADFGIILCAGVKELGRKPIIFNILDYVGEDQDLIKAEKRMLKVVSEELLLGDLWITHFGTHFDIPFLNTRLLYHDLPVLPANHAHIDTWKVSRNRLKLRNNRLATVSEFLKTSEEKNAIKPEQWLRALGGHRNSMAYIAEHCRRDIMVLEETYQKLRGVILDHPSRGLIDGRGGCGVCGGKIIKRGTHVTRTRKYQRFQCQECGAWSKSPKPIEKL